MARQAVRWTLKARTDLLEALEYLVEQSPSVARSFLQRVEQAADSLREFPHRGAVVRELDVAGLRQLVVGRYRLVYRVEDGTVAVVRLVHGSRDVGLAWRGRQ